MFFLLMRLYDIGSMNLRGFLGYFMGKFIKSTYLYIWFIVVVALLMMCLMWSVYLIPVEKIRENTHQSVETLLKTKAYHKSYWKRVIRNEVDAATDARMLNEAGFVGLSEDDFLLNPRIHYVDAPSFSLYHSMNNTDWEKKYVKLLPVFLYQNIHARQKEGEWIDLYPRFWHGYLLFLKPLLVFFDLQGIRYINLVVQLGLLFVILYLMYKRLGFGHCVAFGGAMCFINPVTSWMCLEYANVVNVMLLATLWVLLNKNSDDNYMFFVIGVITILFDFLTFPLVTLGIPLILYLCLYKRGFKKDIRCVVKNSLLWLIGYAGMWFSKWGLATLFTDYNVIKDGWENVLHRTYGITENGDVLSDVTMLHSILSNFEIIWNRNTVVILGVALVLILVSCICSFYVLKIKYQLRMHLKAFVLLCIGLMPFVWYSVLVNHSVVHAYLFTHKIFAVSVYAILSAFVCSLCEVKNEK